MNHQYSLIFLGSLRTLCFVALLFLHDIIVKIIIIMVVVKMKFILVLVLIITLFLRINGIALTRGIRIDVFM